jgi:hypothetical protein
MKSVGGRLPVCSTCVFSKKALDGCPAELLESIKPLLGIVEHLTQEIRRYDKLVTRKAEQKYPQTASILTTQAVPIGEA